MRALPASLLVVALYAHAAAAQGAPRGGDAHVFVDEIRAEKSLSSDATALTTSLCTTMARTRRVEVHCAPDLKQILQFAASAGLMGMQQGTAVNVEERLATVRYVVTGNLRRDGGGYVLVVQAAEKGPESQGVAIVPGKNLLSLEERGDSPKALLARLDPLAARLLAALAPVQAPAPPPPAPLPATPKPTKPG